HRLKMIPLVPHHMHQFDDSPTLKLLNAVADIRAGNGQSLCDLLSIQRLGRDIQKSVNLSDGAVDAPTRAHFPPVEDELLLNWIQRRHCISLISVYSEITIHAKNRKWTKHSTSAAAAAWPLDLRTSVLLPSIRAYR